MEFGGILNYILGGGVLALLIGVLTLKAKVREADAQAEQARAEADKAKAEGESVRIDNAEHATRILIENIVEPLKEELRDTRKELHDTKKEFGSTKREMARLRKAIGDANRCKHSDDCPVLFRLRDLPKSEPGDDHYRNPAIRGQPQARSTESGNGDDTRGTGGDGDSDGQPP